MGLDGSITLSDRCSLRIILLVMSPTPEISSASVAVVTNTRGRRNGDGEIIGTSGDLVGVVRMRSNARHRSKFSYQAAAGQRITGAGGRQRVARKYRT